MSLGWRPFIWPHGGVVAFGLKIAAAGGKPAGDVLWSYPLPKGAPRRPIEPIPPVILRPSPSGPGQWLLPGPDGSIHVLSADGKPIDQFNDGALLAGLATIEIDGQPVLIVATDKAVEACASNRGSERSPRRWTTVCQIVE